MKRRNFLKQLSIVSGGLGVGGFTISCQSIFNKSLKFGITADIHNGYVPNTEKRLQYCLKEIENQNVDFIIDLGDFCSPLKESIEFLNIWKKSPLDKYNTIGNHDTDNGTKKDFMNFVGMKKRYYSFDRSGFHCIVLDPNNIKDGDHYIPYSNSNYKAYKKGRAYVDPLQLKWLEEDLANTNKRCVVFSHQSLENPSACQNQNEVRAILEKSNEEAGFKKVIVAFSGHDHTDYIKEINGIHYVQINSMSYQWGGAKYRCKERFPEEMIKKFKNLDCRFPYQEPLYAIVEIDNQSISITGKQGCFIPPTPMDLGKTTSSKSPLTASITNRIINY